ncbi:MAG: hypothetical protein ACLP22_06250, partial [Solirubrobacteraceae bacterium]
MTDNQTLVRNAYNLAEAQDIPGWINAFAEDGTFTDMSTGVTYRGETLGDLVEIYATGFSDMHRELCRFVTIQVAPRRGLLVTARRQRRQVRAR